MQTNPRIWRTRKSVLIVEDHPIVRRGVRALVEATSSLEVVGEADNGFDAVELAEATCPDVVVLDLSMPQRGGIETIAELRRQLPDVEILVFTLHQSDHLLEQALEAGARGYVCKAETDHLVPALEAVARSEAYFSPGVSEAVANSSGDEAWDRRPLTRREREVVKFVAEGNSNKDIARLLKISVKTTETHRTSAMRKTGTNSAAGLTLYAARNKLVEI